MEIIVVAKGCIELTCRSLPVVLITGVSEDSIAGELAVQISSAKPALLILTARTESRIAPIVEKIRASNSDVKTRFLQMDLSSFSSVRTAAESLQDIPKIDHFAAVAGLMMPPYKKTEDNLESQFQVNYLSNFLLVKLLWPKILAAAPFSSVVILSSSAVRSGGVNFDDTGFSVCSRSFGTSSKQVGMQMLMN